MSANLPRCLFDDLSSPAACAHQVPCSHQVPCYSLHVGQLRIGHRAPVTVIPIGIAGGINRTVARKILLVRHRYQSRIKRTRAHTKCRRRVCCCCADPAAMTQPRLPNLGFKSEPCSVAGFIEPRTEPGNRSFPASPTPHMDHLLPSVDDLYLSFQPYVRLVC